jgi:hypothetical protein
LDVRTGLQDASALAQQRLQTAQLTRLGIGRRQGARPARLAVDLVEQQLLGGQADESGVQRFGEHPLHLGLLTSIGPHVFSRSALQSQDGGAHIGVPDECRDVRTQRARLEGLDVSLGGSPRLGLVDGGDDVLARNGLDPPEQVAGIATADVDRRQRARSEQNGGDAVPHRLGQAWAAQHLDVVVGVHIDHPRQHPLAAGIHDIGAAGHIEGAQADRGDAPVLDADVTDPGRGAGPVEPPAVADDRVVAHERQ